MPKGENMSTPLKRCPYCQRLHPEDDFKKIIRNRVTVAQCTPCWRARRNPEQNKERLAMLVAQQKEENKRMYTGFHSEKAR